MAYSGRNSYERGFNPVPQPPRGRGAGSSPGYANEPLHLHMTQAPPTLTTGHGTALTYNGPSMPGATDKISPVSPSSRSPRYKDTTDAHNRLANLLFGLFCWTNYFLTARRSTDAFALNEVRTICVKSTPVEVRTICVKSNPGEVGAVYVKSTTVEVGTITVKSTPAEVGTVCVKFKFLEDGTLEQCVKSVPVEVGTVCVISMPIEIGTVCVESTPVEVGTVCLECTLVEIGTVCVKYVSNLSL
ncbi:hypothetical protein CHS0354_041027 [Potamilus streckersoni]|uniref:Uncharacterized protein n=1 Tax=Potamilus streckersoni TaxID=2493646 RepID=A0AAE0SW61_9BIVA|nr:hypothetical protein CHS0354_041027 [Potamilus streckersoni]